MAGTVERIFIASRGGGAMKRVLETEAIARIVASGTTRENDSIEVL